MREAAETDETIEHVIEVIDQAGISCCALGSLQRERPELN
jgi:hypothetical protein